MFHETETIESISSRLKISARSLTDNFRKITGQSRLQYINKLRLQHARYLLSETDESVASIAFACGFEDLSNFFRIFRSQEAVSPNQWREKRKSSMKKSGRMKIRSSQPQPSFSLAGGVRIH
jgi:AraC-like DNA-binding protein